MAINYKPMGWSTADYINPTNMNHMDDGIKAACDGVDALNVEMDVVNENLEEISKTQEHEFTSIVDMCKSVETNGIKTFTIGNYQSITDFPSKLIEIGATVYPIVEVKKYGSLAHITVRAMISYGTPYSLNGYLSGTGKLFWGGEPNSDLKWKVKGTVQGTEILALPTSFRECVINGATTAEIDGITEYVNFPEILLLPNALDALPRRYFSTYRISDTAYGYLAFRINSDKTVKIMAAYRNGEDISSRVTWSIRYR